MKWEGTLANLQHTPNGTHYVVCNADESEPGTFKDRVLMEGMALCGYAVGAQRGYLFIRGEYPEALLRLQTAINDAAAAISHFTSKFGAARRARFSRRTKSTCG